MATTAYVVRDDGRYTVVVGWRDDFATFFARVFSPSSGDGTPVHEVGTRPDEIRAVSALQEAVFGFALLDADTVSALRHDAAPLHG